jgi:hypothetical protein
VCIAKTGKPYSIGENLLLASIKDVKTIFSYKLLKDIDLILLSNDIVSRRINDMAGNIESQIIEGVKKSAYYVLQIEETTDVTNDANLMCYVKYAYDSNIHDDILFCRTLPTQTTGGEIFLTLDSYIKRERDPVGKMCRLLFGWSSRSYRQTTVKTGRKSSNKKRIHFTRTELSSCRLILN